MQQTGRRQMFSCCATEHSVIAQDQTSAQNHSAVVTSHRSECAVE
jgi:hypothetical protein